MISIKGEFRSKLKSILYVRPPIIGVVRPIVNVRANTVFFTYFLAEQILKGKSPTPIP